MTKLALLLLGTAASPFVRKARLAAATLRLPLAFQIETPGAPQSKLATFNPLVEVPTLLTPDAGPLYDSRVIIAYLEHVAGVSLRPPEPIAALIDQRIEALADGMSAATGQPAKIEHGLSALASDLDDGRMPREQVTSGVLATVAMLEFLTFRQPDHPWRARHPALAAWATIWHDLPHYDETRPIH